MKKRCFFCKVNIEEYTSEYNLRIKKCLDNGFDCQACAIASKDNSITSFKNPYIEYAIEKDRQLSVVNVRRKFKVGHEQAVKIVESLKTLGIINEEKK